MTVYVVTFQDSLIGIYDNEAAALQVVNAQNVRNGVLAPRLRVDTWPVQSAPDSLDLRVADLLTRNTTVREVR